MIALCLVATLTAVEASYAEAPVDPGMEVKACERHEQCILYHFGCDDLVAINKAHFKEYDRYIYEIGLHGSYLDCEAPPKEAEGMRKVVEAACEDRQCTIKEYNLCLNADCSEQVPACQFEQKIILDEDSFGSSAWNLYGRTPEECRLKCERNFMQNKQRLTGIKDTIVSTRCLWDEEVIETRQYSGRELLE